MVSRKENKITRNRAHRYTCITHVAMGIVQAGAVVFDLFNFNLCCSVQRSVTLDAGAKYWHIILQAMHISQ